MIDKNCYFAYILTYRIILVNLYVFFILSVRFAYSLARSGIDEMNRTRKFLADGLILAAAAVFMRTVGVSWNAYVSNTVGAQSMGLLSLVMSVYSFSVTFACSGVGLGVTRTVSEALGKDDKKGAKRALFIALCYALIFGTTATTAIMFGADFIGRGLLGDPRTVKSVRLLALSMTPIALCTVFNGYFNAVRRVYKSAAANVFEQFVRMGACIMLFTVLLPKGVEGACMAIIAGGTVAECSSSVATGIMCFVDVRRHMKDEKKGRYPTPISRSVKELSVVALPIAASTYIRSALVTLEHMLIPRALKQNGLSHAAALESYGMLGSMVLPVVLYPASLTGSFASLLVPELAEAKARGEHAHISRAANKAILVTFAFAAGVAGIMISYSGALGRVIYSSTEAGRYIRLLAPIIPIMYLDTVIDSMLKGLGYQVYTMTVNIIDAAISVIGVIILIPRLGILGYVILITVSEIINASASFYKLTEIVKLDGSVIRVILMPTLSSILSCYAVKTLYSKLIYVSPETTVGLCLHIISVVVLYGSLCWALHLAKIKKKEETHRLAAV